MPQSPRSPPSPLQVTGADSKASYGVEPKEDEDEDLDGGGGRSGGGARVYVRV
jgi:hypothetical protein